MSGELEAAGQLATAGAIAGAIEGREGRAPGEGDCLNCGAKLQGPFCAQCGQHAHARRKLLHVIDEFLHGLLHLDTKTWRTLPMLFFRPGTLTRNYVFGKRARYLSPLTTFLFSIFFMFFAFSFVDAPVAPTATPAELRADAAGELEEAREELAQAQAELARARASPSPGQPAGLEEGLAEGAVQIAEGRVQRLERLLTAQHAEPEDAARPAAAEQPSTADQGESGPEAPVIDRSWQDTVREAAQDENFHATDSPALNERIRRELQNPDLALYKIQEAASKFSFLLAPLSLPFIALLFIWKRGVTLYDHMVYALYALSFAALLFVSVLATAQTPWTSWLTGWLITAGLPVHTYFHFKGAYALGWFSAVWRTAFMLLFALIVASLFLALIVLVGLVG